MVLPIITTPNSVLINPCQGVKKFDGKLAEIVEQMKQTLDATSDPIGVGLAAPQVGISQQIFVAKPKTTSKHMVFINPKIIDSKDEVTTRNKKKKLLEGCLSIPTIWGKVSRKQEVTIEYRDEKGKPHTKVFRGFPATVIQHEIDHLNGILFTKHVMEQGQKLYRSYKNEKGEDEFEEIKI